MFGVMLYE